MIGPFTTDLEKIKTKWKNGNYMGENIININIFINRTVVLTFDQVLMVSFYINVMIKLGRCCW